MGGGRIGGGPGNHVELVMPGDAEWQIETETLPEAERLAAHLEGSQLAHARRLVTSLETEALSVGGGLRGRMLDAARRLGTAIDRAEAREPSRPIDVRGGDARVTGGRATPAARLEADIRRALDGVPTNAPQGVVENAIARRMFGSAEHAQVSARATAGVSERQLRGMLDRAGFGSRSASVARDIGRRALGAFERTALEQAASAVGGLAWRLENARSGRALDRLTNDVCGPNGQRVIEGLARIGANTSRLREVEFAMHTAGADRTALRAELRTLLGEATTQAAEVVRGLESRIHSAHFLVNETGQLYDVFATSVARTAAELGVPSAALHGQSSGSSLLEDAIAERVRDSHDAREHERAVEIVGAVVIGVVGTVVTGGGLTGMLCGLFAGAARGGVEICAADAAANELGASAEAGAGDRGRAADARVHVRQRAAVTVAAVGGEVMTAGVATQLAVRAEHAGNLGAVIGLEVGEAASNGGIAAAHAYLATAEHAPDAAGESREGE